MKNILVLGAGGMAGSMVCRYLNSLNKYEIEGVTRQDIDVELNFDDLYELLKEKKFDAVINCIGVLIKDSQNTPCRAIYINSLFPHLLEDLFKNMQTKLIHLSTDCVFDGYQGNYSETEWPTETSWYGRTKALGEVINDKDLTLRTSIVGPDLDPANSGDLFSWFMRQSGEISGYANVYWNGVTTLELAKQIDRILDTDLSGLYHLTSDEIMSKYNLLLLFKQVWNKDIAIKSDFSVIKNKRLVNNCKRFYDPNIPLYKTQFEELRDSLPTLNYVL